MPKKEEFVYTTDEALEEHLKTLNKKKILGLVLFILGIVLLFLCGLLFAVDFPLAPVAALLALGVLITGIVFFAGKAKKIKSLASLHILTRALRDVFDSAEHEPFRHLPPADCLPLPHYDKIKGGDYIRAVYHGLGVQMSDLTLIEITYRTDSDGHTHREETTVFKGQYMVCDFQKELSTELTLRERFGLGRSLQVGGIKTESEEFNRRFLIRSENEHEAFYVLTPHMMEYILSMDERAGGQSYLAFERCGRVHIAINNQRDAFEVRGKISVPRLREQFVRELRSFTDLIDELRLVDTLYKK